MAIGDGTDADRWGAAIALAGGTTTTQASFTAFGIGAGGTLTLTPDAGTFSALVVRAHVYYIPLTAPTS